MPVFTTSKGKLAAALKPILGRVPPPELTEALNSNFARARACRYWGFDGEHFQRFRAQWVHIGGTMQQAQELWVELEPVATLKGGRIPSVSQQQRKPKTGEPFRRLDEHGDWETVRVCGGCGEAKRLRRFAHHDGGLRCRGCNNERLRRSYRKHRAKRLAARRAKYEDPTYREAHLATMRLYRQENREYINAVRRATDQRQREEAREEAHKRQAEAKKKARWRAKKERT